MNYVTDDTMNAYLRSVQPMYDGVLGEIQKEAIAQTRFSVPRRQRTIHKRLRNFLWEITHHDALETSIIPIGDGVALCYKKKEIIPETKTEGETKNAE